MIVHVCGIIVFCCTLCSCFSVFIKRFWEKLFSTDVVETGIERLIVG